MPYLPSTDNDRREMLRRIGVPNIEDIFSVIPTELRLSRSLNIPALSEMEVLREIEQMSKENHVGLVCFAGGGVYDHFIPSAVNTIISRPEFLTAYTPYQPEVSQGTLQVMYEFQTHICRLTGMDVANASLYDGASAAAEAVIIATRVTKRNKVVVSETVAPLYREVVSTYLSARDVELVIVPMKRGVTDLDRMEAVVDEKTACVLVSQPNFFGLLEDVEPVAEMIHRVGGKFIMSVDPIAQAILKTPADYEADIAVGEGQPLGLPLSFGGPLLGFFAAKKELVRNMPGRIAGRTTDIEGKTGFVLVLQTREQHIRREKATSNICTNQALCATAASVYISLLGKTGLRKVALLSSEKAHQTAAAISQLEGFELYFNSPFVREFAVRTPILARQLILSMMEHQILAG
ncbi:MAG: aminomethyl-transferring glycine dehydrogenase subunit GcvPA, partial [Candidatus Zixiibacteriota bacterium]